MIINDMRRAMLRRGLTWMSYMRLSFAAPLFAAILAVSVPLASAPLSAATAMSHVVIHIDDDDPARMNMALGNAENIEKYFAEKDEEVTIEFVTNGPGLTMLREDISPVKERIAKMLAHHDNLVFSACANSVHTVEEKTGQKVALLPETVIVPSGVVRLMELQGEGYSYLRP